MAYTDIGIFSKERKFIHYLHNYLHTLFIQETNKRKLTYNDPTYLKELFWQDINICNRISEI